MTNRTPELLAPVGNTESFYAALSGGANAVFMGLQEFNARGRASNFTRPMLQLAVRKAHEKNVKVYITLNTLIKNKEIDKFYDEILKATWGYLSDKLSIPVSELTRTNAIAALSAKGIDDERIMNLNHLLDTCEFSRFSPSSSGTEAESIFESATQFIKSVENSIG